SQVRDLSISVRLIFVYIKHNGHKLCFFSEKFGSFRSSVAKSRNLLCLGGGFGNPPLALEATAVTDQMVTHLPVSGRYLIQRRNIEGLSLRRFSAGSDNSGIAGALLAFKSRVSCCSAHRIT